MNFAYKDAAVEALQTINRPELDPGHVIGLMRMDYGTLDHLPRRVFVMFANTVADYVDQGYEDVVEDIAESYAVPTKKSEQARGQPA